MQNFKQYLKEENDLDSIILFVEYDIELHGSTERNVEDYLRYKSDDIKKEVYAKTKINIDNVKVNVYAHTASLQCPLETAEQIRDVQHIQDEIVKITDDLDYLVFDNISTNVEIRFEKTLPENIKINYPIIYLTPIGHSLNVSLKGIDKIIGDFEQLHIWNIDKISSNVLGLLKLNNPPKSEVNIPFAKKPETKLLKKCIDSNMDLLDCQEELISKGFKQYAKL